jgi:hypothetical protein
MSKLLQYIAVIGVLKSKGIQVKLDYLYPIKYLNIQSEKLFVNIQKNVLMLGGGYR